MKVTQFCKNPEKYGTFHSLTTSGSALFYVVQFENRSLVQKSRHEGGRCHKADRLQVRLDQDDGFHGDLRFQVKSRPLPDLSDRNDYITGLAS